MNRAAVLGGVVVLACAPCAREACDALSKRAPEQASQSRVAGVVASESDLVANGCQECSFSEAPLHAWPVTQAVTTDAELRRVATESPVAAGASSKQGTYSLALAAGDYLVCAQNSCFNVSVMDARTTTLNVRLINGVSSGFVGLPDSSGLTRSDALFLPPDLNP